MRPVSKIYLCRIPELPADYSHTWRFDNILEQQKFFLNKGTKIYESYTYLREEASIKVNDNIDDLYGYNYLFYKNKNGKHYYCFIMDRIYINENTTQLVITTDLLQTFQFDFRLKESYVERCHSHRWNRDGSPVLEIEPEGLEYGEHVQTERQTVYTYKDTFIAVTSNPLGKINVRPKPIGGPDDSGCGDWENGIISPEGFRFIKGWEGYAENAYLDTVAKPPVWTICYGVTEHGEPDVYKYLKAREPVPEPIGAQTSYYLKNERYGKVILQACKDAGITQQYQFDALVSFSYNLGTAYIMNPNSAIRRAIAKNPTDEVTMRSAFLQYTSGGVLTERRNRECDMFLGRPPVMRPIVTVIGSGQYGPPITENNGNGWLPSCDSKPGTCKLDYNIYNLDWTYPTHGRIESIFPTYPSSTKFHGGTDIGCPIGTPVYATRDLDIELAGELKNPDGTYRSYGVYIIAKVTGTPYKLWYGHLDRHNCKTGDKVKCGDIIAYSGNTGNSTGPHLHYEMRKPPYNYGDIQTGKGTSCIEPIPGLVLGQQI